MHLHDAACHSWMQIRFDNGNWIEEILARLEGEKYYINDGPVDEDTFHQQIDTYYTEDVPEYKPCSCK